MKTTILTLALILSMSFYVMSQNNDSVIIANIYENALTSNESYNNLKVLCDSASPRMIGSEESIVAVNILQQQLQNKGFDKVYLQEFTASVWRCNSPSRAVVKSEGNVEYALEVVELGPSVSTNSKGVTAGVIELRDIQELELLGKEKVEGKIVFFNTPMRNAFANPINAYVEAVGTRLFGTSRAAEFGAVGVLMRSLTTCIDEFPHTGSTIYDDKFEKLPVLAISSKDSEYLSKLLKEDPSLITNIFVDSEIVDSVISYNIIAEIKGKINPDEIIAIGAHIDAWTAGAQDDGAGCVQMMDVLRVFEELEIDNNKTIRVIIFMDEELNKSGAKAYADYFDDENETIIAAIESDLGGYAPDGFLIDAQNETINHIKAFGKQLLPYGLYNIDKGFGGGDMIVLKKKYGFPSIALRVESQRYFEIIHTANDTFDKIHRRELQLGTAAIASMVYLIDKYGIEKD